jgi:hypothetical protein
VYFTILNSFLLMWKLVNNGFHSTCHVQVRVRIHYPKVQNLHKGSFLRVCKNSLTYGAEPYLRSRQLCSHSRTSQHLLEPDGSLPCSQEPSTGLYPEPDKYSPYHPISLRYILILSINLCTSVKSYLEIIIFLQSEAGVDRTLFT